MNKQSIVLIIFRTDWFYSRRVKAPFRALCTLFVLCYTNITGLSLKILHFAKLGDRYVLYQNGELKFFRGKHIAYGLVAIAYILVIVIPVPLFLMFTPFFVKKGQKYFRINLNTFKVSWYFILLYEIQFYTEW